MERGEEDGAIRSRQELLIRVRDLLVVVAGTPGKEELGDLVGAVCAAGERRRLDSLAVDNNADVNVGRRLVLAASKKNDLQKRLVLIS